MKRLALIGSKDLAEQIQNYVARTGTYSVVGFFDDYVESGTIIRGLPILGKISDAEKKYSEGFFDYVFFAAGYNNFSFREKVFSSLSEHIPFANIIDPSVSFGQNTKVGKGIYIGPDSIIGDNTIIGDNVFIHGNTIIAHDNVIGNHTYISGRVDTAGFCCIGERNFVGIKVLFSDHVKTCNDVWIGLGCIVAKDIKEPGKYMSPSAKLYKIE